jgi:pyrimidine-nucleoside phosphorylase
LRVIDLIKAKRDGARLEAGEIGEFLRALTAGAVPDYQVAALLMAIVFRGLDDTELTAWTEGMLRSGEVVDLSAVRGSKVDKHSTGGVGDKVSICLAPLVAACGVRVPMVAGRGLGHTGGTIDKLESITGFQVSIPIARYREILSRVGAVLIGQTDEIAPADRKLYALRDVTGTVESIPLIAASIMSKKLAEGIDALVLDVKVGQGAFMKTETQARRLAQALIGIGERMGKPTVAVLSAMEQPLGFAVGNALEIAEAVETLEGKGPPELRELTLELGCEMLALGRGLSPDEARRELEARLASGAGLEKLLAIVEAQGGDPKVLEKGGAGLPKAPERVSLAAPRGGFVQSLNAELVGRAAMALGAGRETLEDRIDPAVGIVLQRKVSDAVQAGEALATIHGRTKGIGEAMLLLERAYRIDGQPVASPRLVIDRVVGQVTGQVAGRVPGGPT